MFYSPTPPLGDTLLASGSCSWERELIFFKGVVPDLLAMFQWMALHQEDQKKICFIVQNEHILVNTLREIKDAYSAGLEWRML